MASLTGQSVASTYSLLVKLPSAGLSTSYKAIEDGAGTVSALSVSTLGIKSTGLIESTGNAAIGGNASVSGTLTATGASTIQSTLSVTGASQMLNTLSVAGLITAPTGMLGPVTGNLNGNTTGTHTGDVIGNVTGNVTGNASGSSSSCTGNAATAAALQTPRTIQLTGVILGSASFDGSSNISIATTTAGTAVPSGIIVPFAGTAVPNFWRECNGDAISRTTFAPLFAAIGETYGPGDGSTTFNIPDLRGEFVRGWDHGRGVDAGRVIGSAQADEIEAHTHSISVPATNNQAATPMAFMGDSSQGTLATNTGSVGGTETRPRNIAIMYIIKL